MIWNKELVAINAHSQTPKDNSQTYEKHYEIVEGLKQHVYIPKAHRQNGIQRIGA
jgi:hypothetical protein